MMNRFTWTGLLALSLLGCSDDPHTDTRTWMEQTKANVKPAIEVIPKSKKFDPFTYQLQDQIDPFNAVKLSRVLDAKAGKRNAPNQDRRREPLEAFPLDQLRMVGTIRNGKLTYALVEADKSLYQLKVGNYLGQNYGMVVAITETEMKIKETIQDQAGEWIERENSLVLQEATQEAKK
ncbi:pilus assembly protein PilP [Parvibium lacunae]|uniref:Pilus assembly protein PilP n=1 Tax=Parvibium lacunae TaxID=1888893 RepID=A0A368KYW2_9BURK|nr:pilus assembly protein PilP [Parvibium lacunae]RCS56587.1 pilus assembly protein PilP [Parvibium lacunae]